MVSRCWSPPITWTRLSAVTRSPISLTGHSLAHGTVDEGDREIRASTYTVTGDDLNGLSAELTGKPGIDMVVPSAPACTFRPRSGGAEAMIAPFIAITANGALHFSTATEDVLIDLMNRPKDNFNEHDWRSWPKPQRPWSRYSGSGAAAMRCCPRNSSSCGAIVSRLR